MERITKSVEETKEIAREFGEHLLRSGIGERATVVALLGDLGAGKTTFVQYLGEVFGAEDLMQSPTFVIERRYPISGPFSTLIHIDAYRIERPEEMEALQFGEDLLNTEALIVIEWADNIKSLLPLDTHTIRFTHQGPKARGITIEGI